MKLVSVGVSTYNSSKFVLETLDSIRDQTYEHLELIIGDDGSTDNTLPKIKSWLKKSENSRRFTNIKVIEAPRNEGIPANANKQLKAAEGEWIKFIAGDDILYERCIEKNFHYISCNPEVRILFSKINVYKEVFKSSNFVNTTPGIINKDSIFWNERTVESQYNMLLLNDRIHFSPSVFMHNKTISNLGGFDERFKLLEDYPLWINLTRNGIKLHFMNEVTVGYRSHSGAVNNNGLSRIINPNYFFTEDFRRIYTYPYLPKDIRLRERYKWIVNQVFKLDFLNKRHKVNIFIFYLLNRYLNPFIYLIWFRKRLNRRLIKNDLYK